MPRPNLNMFDIALGIFLLLSPIFLLPKQIGNVNALQFYQFGVLGNNGYNFLQLQFFQLGVLVLLMIAFVSKPIRELNDKNVLFLFLTFLISVFLHPISVRNFGNVFLGFLLYYLVVVYTKDYKKLFKFIAIVSIINCAFSLLQYFGIHLIYRPTGRIDGLMCLSTHLGVYQAIALPICYAVNPWLIIFPIITITLSKSITAILLMCGWLLFTYWKKIFERGTIFFMLCLSMLTAFLIHNWQLIIQKLNIRIMVWIPTLKMTFSKLFAGHGIVQFKYLSPLGLFENPCSIYLELIFFLGVLSLIPLFLFLKNILTSSNKVLVSAVAVALIAGIEKSFMDYPRLAGTVIVLFGLLTIAKGENHAGTLQRRPFLAESYLK